MLIGLAAGVFTSALWSLTFVAARAVEPYSPWDITIARYSVFGVLSLLLMLLPRFRPRGVRWPIIAAGFGLGTFSYTGYALSIAFAVREAGAAVPPLIVGTSPIALAIVGNLGEKSVAWRALAVPLALIAAGVFTVNGAALAHATPAGQGDVWLGSLWAFAGLALWVGYGAANTAVMRNPRAPSAVVWTCLQGAGALVGSLVLLPLSNLLAPGSLDRLATTPEGWRFIGWTMLMGIGGSWFAAWAWIVASQRLPLALAAQLVVFETLFGLINGFIFEHRWPAPAEAIGSALQLTGVVVGIYIFTRPPAAVAVEAGPPA